jgi:transposase
MIFAALEINGNKWEINGVSLACRLRHPETMKNGGVPPMLPVDVTGDEAAMICGALEPACQSGPGHRRVPEIVAPFVGEHAEQIAPLLDVFSGAVPWRDPMDIVYPCCAGLDLHKKTVVACVRRQQLGAKLHKEVRTFGTMTADLLALADWLVQQGVTHVAMESTGVYWKPVWNILEGQFQLLLVNARHIKQVPGRKTDVKDSEWIAELLQHGLLKGSFVPAAPQRELRELTRQRMQLMHQKATVANRLQKILEDANLKLASVATDILGLSGRDMLQAIIGGQEDPQVLAELARGKLRAKIPVLQVALKGRVTDHHRFLLKLLLDQVTQVEDWIERLNQRITAALGEAMTQAVPRLVEVPGIGERAAENILAEIGTNMDQFPTAGHLCSWVGMCPGNNESAGKRKSGRTTKGNQWLRATLVQVAWAASHTKETYVAAQYRRLAGRRGKKRALVAVAHTILVILYHLLKKPEATFRELGPAYLDRLDSKQLTRHLVRRLERLGHKVTLEVAEGGGQVSVEAPDEAPGANESIIIEGVGERSP